MKHEYRYYTIGEPQYAVPIARAYAANMLRAYREPNATHTVRRMASGRYVLRCRLPNSHGSVLIRSDLMDRAT